MSILLITGKNSHSHSIRRGKIHNSSPNLSTDEIYRLTKTTPEDGWVWEITWIIHTFDNQERKIRADKG